MSGRSSPASGACGTCDSAASIASDMHKYQSACTCGGSVQYACAEEGVVWWGRGVRSQGRRRHTACTAAATTAASAPGQTECTHNSPTTQQWGSHKFTSGSAVCMVVCGVWGSSSCTRGLLAAAHILLRSYTASPQHLETVPAAVPAAMLVLTGLCIMSLARRRNRYSYMIKVVGACCLVCALTCVLVTITTTVIHMNKLQALRECLFTKLTKTCTCFSIPLENQPLNGQDEGVKCEFEGVRDCEVVHGALYWCLRAVFALSVCAVLVCIFSSMLAYQLLSHERKKMYWEQLELRCRSLYRLPTNTNAATLQRQQPIQQPGCACCAQCHASPPAWDMSMQHRFWAPGRIETFTRPTLDRQGGFHLGAGFRGPEVLIRASSGDSAYGFCEGGAMGVPAGSTAEHGGATAAPGTVVWGPPPPYSPEGRQGNRPHQHVVQDPAAANLLHHHHHHHQHVVHTALLSPAPRHLYPATRDSEMVGSGGVVCLHGKMTPGKEEYMEDANCSLQDVRRLQHLHRVREVEVMALDAVNIQGKENLAFQNDKHSPLRASMHLDCHRVANSHNAESEVYFADVSSCCNVSVKADCCGNPNVSGLVGTIENHPESTSESEAGSFTLTRKQRPQPQQTSAKRRQGAHATATRPPGFPALRNISPKHQRVPPPITGNNFFVPLQGLQMASPISPDTEESVMSEDETGNKMLGPDLQYEPVRDTVPTPAAPEQRTAEPLPTKAQVNHHHCYSDTNTMDSGWQSGSEKLVTD